jgi:small subunit ribosomal protein S9
MNADQPNPDAAEVPSTTSAPSSPAAADAPAADTGSASAPAADTADTGDTTPQPTPAARMGTPKVRGPYTWGLGRRKSAVARVRIKSGAGNFVVNGKPVDEYFTTIGTRKRAQSPLVCAAAEGIYDVFVNVNGGGPTGQSGAVELGLARALKDVNPAVFDTLREAGHLTRDSRMKERKKYGRRGARRGFQFSKR